MHRSKEFDGSEPGGAPPIGLPGESFFSWEMERTTEVAMGVPQRRPGGQHLWRAPSMASLGRRVPCRGNRPQGWQDQDHALKKSNSCGLSMFYPLFTALCFAAFLLGASCAADVSGAAPRQRGTLASGDALVAEELEELLLRVRAAEQDTENAYARATAPQAYLAPSILSAWYLPPAALTHCSPGESPPATGASAGARRARVLWGSCAAEREFPVSPRVGAESDAHGPGNGTASGEATSSPSDASSSSIRGEGSGGGTPGLQEAEEEAYRRMCNASAYRTLSPGALARVALFGGLRRRRDQHLLSISLFNAPLESTGAETGTGTGAEAGTGTGNERHAPGCSDLKPLVVHLNAEGTMGAEDPLANLAALLQRPEQPRSAPTARVTLVLHAPLGVPSGHASGAPPSHDPERERERQSFFRFLGSLEDHLRHFEGERCLRIVVVHFLASPNATAAPLLRVQAPEAAQLGLSTQTSTATAASVSSRASKRSSSSGGGSGGNEGAFGSLLSSVALECRLLRLAVALGVEVRLIAVHLGSVQSTAGAGMHIGCKVGALPPPFLISSSVAYAAALAARVKVPGRKPGAPSDLDPPPPPGWQGVCFFLDSSSLLLNPQQSSPTMAALASEAMASWVNVLSQAADDSPLSQLGTKLLQGTRGGGAQAQGDGSQGGAAPSVVLGTARALGSIVGAARGAVAPLRSFFSPLPFRFSPNAPWSILPGHTGRWDEASFASLAVAYVDFARVGGVPFWHQQAPPWWSPGAALKDVLLQSLLQWPTQMLQRLPHHSASLPPATPQGALGIERWECPELVHLPQETLPSAAATSDIAASGMSDEADRSEEE